MFDQQFDPYAHGNVPCQVKLPNGNECGKDHYDVCLDCDTALCENCCADHDEVCEAKQPQSPQQPQQNNVPKDPSAEFSHVLSEIKQGRMPSYLDVMKARNELTMSNVDWYAFVEAFVKKCYPNDKDQKWKGNPQGKKQRPPQLILKVIDKSMFLVDNHLLPNLSLFVYYSSCLFSTAVVYAHSLLQDRTQKM